MCELSLGLTGQGTLLCWPRWGAWLFQPPWPMSRPSLSPFVEPWGEPAGPLQAGNSLEDSSDSVQMVPSLLPPA